MVGSTDCTQILVAPHSPDSLEAELSVLGPFVVSEATILRAVLPCDTEQKQSGLDLCFAWKEGF